MSLTDLGPGGEFDVIRRILAGAGAAPDRVTLSAGDDCALIDAGDAQLAISVDMTVEGVHFLPAWGSYEQAGRRAVLAALSDLAAMGADPLAVLIALSVPAATEADIAERIGRAGRDAAEAAGAALIGGDISRGGAGLSVDVAALGLVEEPLLRSRVRPGDELWVTGRLGGAAAAVSAWQEGREVAESWRERFWEPRPRLAEARWLRGRGAVAAIDLSDGLIADAGHLAAASGVGLEIDAERVPAEPGVDVARALSGGEDYELLVAVRPGIFGATMLAEFETEFETSLTRVGRAVSGAGVRVFHGEEEVKVDLSGFDHFRGQAES